MTFLQQQRALCNRDIEQIAHTEQLRLNMRELLAGVAALPRFNKALITLARSVGNVEQ